jgi:hypothetical protein
MPKGPRGEKRPADVIGAAVKVMRIATGEEEEELPDSAIPGRRRSAVIRSSASRARADKTPHRAPPVIGTGSAR